MFFHGVELPTNNGAWLDCDLAWRILISMRMRRFRLTPRQGQAAQLIIQETSFVVVTLKKDTHTHTLLNGINIGGRNVKDNPFSSKWFPGVQSLALHAHRPFQLICKVSMDNWNEAAFSRILPRQGCHDHHQCLAQFHDLAMRSYANRTYETLLNPW